MGSWWAGFALATLVALPATLVALPAHAIRCSEWVDLSAQQRDEALRSEFRALLESPRAAKWTSINRGRINACLVRSIRTIEIDFDDVCAQGNRASPRKLDELLLGYAITCANR